MTRLRREPNVSIWVIGSLYLQATALICLRRNKLESTARYKNTVRVHDQRQLEETIHCLTYAESSEPEYTSRAPVKIVAMSENNSARCIEASYTDVVKRRRNNWHI